MKENGYVLIGRDDGVKADWDRFATELGEDGFFEEIERSGRARTLVGEPPKKQVCVDGVLDWRPVRPATNAQQLFEGIRRARNNLVHGGKSGDPEADPQNRNRGDVLIAEAQWVLEQAIERNHAIKWSFEGLY